MQAVVGMSTERHPAGHAEDATGPMQKFIYDDAIARMFLVATLVFGIVAFLVGVIVAAELALPTVVDQTWTVAGMTFRPFGWLKFLTQTPFLNFGRLRPLHTNAAIFAFAGNSIFAAIYYSTQRLCKTRMFSDVLSRIHFWGWQLIIVAAAVSLPLGITSGKEYAELEWPIDLAIAVVWVVFAINFFGTLAIRRERHLYVAIWFYIATIITVALLHIFNSLEVPVSLLKSYPIYAGAQDAFMQWWYGHNAVAFFLTTPFLGLMYYFVPKAAERPVFSYRLSIVHFWSLVFIYIWAGPHHLHYTALPEWASSLGMLFSVMLWMPSWGGMINGLLTLRGAWNKVAADPVLKFYVVGITFYGMSTFEGPMLSVKSVNALSHYTDWTIGHVHAGTLGWNGFMTFGMLYWLLPRLFQTKLWSSKLAEVHFWLATVGILLYIVAMYTAGLTQGLMWRAIDEGGQLKYPDFIETVAALIPMYWVRVIAGVAYLGGTLICAVNFAMTFAARKRPYDVVVHEAPALARTYVDVPEPPSQLTHVAEFAKTLDVFSRLSWHRRWEHLPLRFSVWVAIAVVAASLFEIIPTFLIKSNIPTIATVQPYTPLELAGRDLYIAEGCYNCHSQMIRPILAETKRFGEYSKPGEFVFDHPFQWGSRRIGPDLQREGVSNPLASWHYRHFRDPREVIPKSVMPAYPWLEKTPFDFASVQARINAMRMLGVDYDARYDKSEELAREQARNVARQIVERELTPDIAKPEEIEAAIKQLEDKQVVVLIAYLQRLGTDLHRTAEPAAEAPKVASGGGAAQAAPSAGGD